MTETSPKRTRKEAMPADGERVELTRPHTHGGKAYPTGTLITVPTGTAEWLRGQGVIAKTATPQTPSTETTED